MPIDFTHITYLESGNLRQKAAYHAIRSLGILADLAAYSPLLTGTIPLEIDTPSSDLDIICTRKNHGAFLSHITRLYGHMPDFESHISTYDDMPATVATFRYNHFKWEIFGQNRPTVEQNAYRHMCVEHQLLLTYGSDLKWAVIQFKKRGIKTEPAFAQLLGLTGDPYQALLTYPHALENHYSETHHTWNALALAYQEKFMHLRLYTDTYRLFCQAISFPTARVLELGCGPGNITQHLLQIHPHLRIHATDVAPEMVKQVSRQFPQITTQVLDATQLESLTPTEYDGIMAGFIIPYLSPIDVLKLVKSAGTILRQHGIIYLSFVPGPHSQSGFKTGATGQRTYFYYHTTSFMRLCLEICGFEELHIIEKTYVIAQDTSEKHQIIIGRKVAHHW